MKGRMVRLKQVDRSTSKFLVINVMSYGRQLAYIHIYVKLRDILA